MAIDRQHFFQGARALFGGRYKQSQVDGLNAILDHWDEAAPDADRRWLAYMLATAFHETAREMQPVREAFWLPEEWRRRNLRYYPYYGRGFVQLTWQDNYARAGAFVGADLVSRPDLALRLDFAAAIMRVGMTEGWFRRDRQGRPQTLGRYFGHGADDPVGAREIINGPEWKTVNQQRVLLATIIAQYHRAFVGALGAAPAPDLAPEAAVAIGVATVPFAVPADVDGTPDGLDLAVLAEAASGQSAPRQDVLALTASVVTGYVQHNEVAPEALPGLLAQVYAALTRLAASQTGIGAAPVPPGGTDDLGALASAPFAEAATAGVGAAARRVIDVCEDEWPANRSDCSAFVRDVAAALGVRLTGNADAIVDQIAGSGWHRLADGRAAKAAADQGLLVVGGLKGGDQTEPSEHGHVVVVVSGELAHGRYPTAYWGRLGGIGERRKTVNWAWRAADRDRVTYASRALG